MKTHNYSAKISELKHLKQYLKGIYGVNTRSINEIDDICSVFSGIDLYLNPKKKINLLILGRISDHFDQSFLKYLFPKGISKLFLKKCEGGIERIVFNNVNNQDQVYISIKNEVHLTEEKRFLLQNRFHSHNLDIHLNPGHDENLYEIENSLASVDFKDHMGSILFGNFNEKFSLFYENDLIKELFISKNFNFDSDHPLKSINKILWIPNKRMNVTDISELENTSKYIEETLGFDYYTFICGSRGEEFLPTIVETNNQQLLNRIGSNKQDFVNLLIQNRCFFDNRIDFKKEKELLIDFLTIENGGRYKFVPESSFDISEQDTSILTHIFKDDCTNLLTIAERMLNEDISHINLKNKNFNRKNRLSSKISTETLSIESFDFLKAVFVTMADLLDDCIDIVELINELREHIGNFEDEHNLKLIAEDYFDDLETLSSEKDFIKNSLKQLEFRKKVFNLYGSVLSKLKHEMKENHSKIITNSEEQEKKSLETIDDLLEYIKALIGK